MLIDDDARIWNATFAIQCHWHCFSISTLVAHYNVWFWGAAKSNTLLKANVSAVSLSECSNTFNSRTYRKLPRGLTIEMLCAGDPTGAHDACQVNSSPSLSTAVHCWTAPKASATYPVSQLFASSAHRHPFIRHRCNGWGVRSKGFHQDLWCPR